MAAAISNVMRNVTHGARRQAGAMTKNGWHRVQRHHVRPVRRCIVRVLMSFHEQAVHPYGNGGTRQHRHEFRCPPELPPRPPGCCTEWVASKTTGCPRSAICGNARMSDTSVL